MKIQIIKTGAIKTKNQIMACDSLIDEPPMDKKK
jgi:hypothetical protein